MNKRRPHIGQSEWEVPRTQQPAKPRRTLLSSRQFFDLLRERNAENAAEIDARIESLSNQTLAVMSCDASGFTRFTVRHGILQFLTLLVQAYDQLTPIIEQHKGDVLSHSADNILAVFKKPQEAVQAAIEMQRFLARHNADQPESNRFNICIGLHYGECIRLRDNVYGDTVNVAFKLGEDTARRDEILITQALKDELQDKYDAEYSQSADIGGRRYELFIVKW